ncbi:uncharacterized protein TNCV_3339841 [Trichonephila clavipes]|nr:uncharacterized protein TNCV_3339841 [Trichonephila clavipes]
MMTRRKWYTHEFLAKSQKLLETAPTSKDAGLTPPAEGMSNISKYPGHLPDFAYSDGNPRNQGGVNETCVNKTTLHMAPEEEVWAGEVRRACWPIYRTTPPNPSPWICCYMQWTSHICAEMCRRSVLLEPHTSLYVGWNTLQ